MKVAVVKRRANPRCCRACNRPLIALADAERFQDACHACHARAASTENADHACRVCGEADPRMLRARRLADGWMLLCANHAAVLAGRWLRLSELLLECREKRSA